LVPSRKGREGSDELLCRSQWIWPISRRRRRRRGSGHAVFIMIAPLTPLMATKGSFLHVKG